MIETPQYLLAVVVVCVGLAILVFFMGEGVVTSNIYKQGVKLYEEKHYKGAEEAFRNVLSRHPSNDVVRLLLGEVLMQQAQLEEAIAQFKELISRAPKNVDAHLQLGKALVKQEKIEEAIAALQTAKDLFKAQRNDQKANWVEQLLEQISTQQNLT